MQYLLVPVRLEAALTAMDTDRDGHIDIDEWETCIEDALKNKLAARAAKRELDAKNAAKEIEEFTNEFLSAARRCFELIDKDGGGTLSTAEIVEAVKSDAEVIDFLKNCGEENLQFLLHPPRLDKALDALDTDKSGELDIEECTARRLFVSERFALLTARLLHRGSRHQPRPREAPGAAGRRARAPPARRGAGRRRIHARIFERGARGLPNDRQGRLGNAR